MQQWSQPFENQLKEDASYTADLETNFGTITAEFYPEDAPKTVNNFVRLAREGFYDGTVFHRVVKGFVIQGGDPTGTGAGGPGYKFEDEPIVKDYEPGTLAMANAGPNTNGSQFFIVLEDMRGRLPKNYTIFGKVTDGMDVVKKIGDVPVQPSPSGEPSSPVERIELTSVKVNES
ncbi:MAG TPA: peptidylprolyl isomerase [Thermomicrobiales bacterium]|nr:peptidylprolyl isomerase [Thermomicrobiales bacterium]